MQQRRKHALLSLQEMLPFNGDAVPKLIKRAIRIYDNISEFAAFSISHLGADTGACLLFRIPGTTGETVKDGFLGSNGNPDFVRLPPALVFQHSGGFKDEYRYIEAATFFLCSSHDFIDSRVNDGVKTVECPGIAEYYLAKPGPVNFIIHTDNRRTKRLEQAVIHIGSGFDDFMPGPVKINNMRTQLPEETGDSTFTCTDTASQADDYHITGVL